VITLVPLTNNELIVLQYALDLWMETPRSKERVLTIEGADALRYKLLDYYYTQDKQDKGSI